jgi:serine/threonine protein kinase
VEADTEDQIGPYVLKRRLSEGGMGALYVGHLGGDAGEREVAIKVVDPVFCGNRNYVEAFRREAETAARIDHPNVVQVFDRGEDNGTQYLVMELLHGRSLAEVFMRGRAEDLWIPPELAVWAVARAAEGLHHVHESCDDDGTPLDMVHGDVSPQNIFVTASGQVKIIDFGLAHSALPASGDESPAKLYGKVHYLSPEQCAGRPIDRRADVFALGATLYEALTTHSAFSAASKFLVIFRISQGQADPIRDHLPELDPALESVVERSIAHDPEDRYRSADQVREALDNYLAQRRPDLGAGHFAAYLGRIFGDEVDAAAAATGETLRPTTRPPQSERRESGRRRSGDRSTTAKRSLRPQSATLVEIEDDATPTWMWIAAGISTGLVGGILWLLLRSAEIL